MYICSVVLESHSNAVAKKSRRENNIVNISHDSFAGLGWLINIVSLTPNEGGSAKERGSSAAKVKGTLPKRRADVPRYKDSLFYFFVPEGSVVIFRFHCSTDLKGTPTTKGSRKGRTR